MFSHTLWTGGDDKNTYKQVDLVRESDQGEMRLTAWIPGVFAVRDQQVRLFGRTKERETWTIQNVYTSEMTGDAIYKMRHQEIRKTGSSHPPVDY